MLNFTLALYTKKCVLQGSILALVIFSVLINDLSQGMKSANIHRYTDNITVFITVGLTMNEAIELLQAAFHMHSKLSLLNVKLVLKPKKTKYVLFSCSHSI